LERDPVPLKDAFFVHLALIGIYPIGEIDEWKVIIGNIAQSIARRLPKDIEDIS
jgi:branched-subunit amino acid aminotransferase/4-amino-4-deoxychorismate lyase